MPNATAIVQSYFDSLAHGDFSQVPWSPGVILRTPLHPAGPIVGREAVEAFFRPMAGTLGKIELVGVYFSEDGNVVVGEARVGPLHVLDKFVLEEGRIIEQVNVFDPRPVL
jgi:hypothetical protein